MNRELREKIIERIDQLREYGLEDGFDMNESSQKDFWEFVASIHIRENPAVFLHENGNLRVLLLCNGIGQAGIEFFGEGAVEFVFYNEYNDIWKAGNCVLYEVKERIKSFGLSELVG